MLWKIQKFKRYQANQTYPANIMTVTVSSWQEADIGSNSFGLSQLQASEKHSVKELLSDEEQQQDDIEGLFNGTKASAAATALVA